MTRGSALPSPKDFDRQLPVAEILDEFLATQYVTVNASIGEGHRGALDRENVFHMSGAGCLRKDVMEVADLPRLPSPGTSARTFAMGHMTEAMLDAAFQWKGIVLEKNIKLWRDYAFRAGRGQRFDADGRMILDDVLSVGTLDWLLRWPPPPAERFLVFLADAKSVHSKKFDLYLNEIDASYATQQLAYWTTYEETPDHLKRYHGTIDQARLIYFCKDDGRIKQMGIDRAKWEPEARLRWRNQRASLERFKRTGELADELVFKASGEPNWKCNPLYCGFAAALKSDGTPACPTVRRYWKLNADKSRVPLAEAPYPVRAIAISEGHDPMEPTQHHDAPGAEVDLGRELVDHNMPESIRTNA